MIVPINAHPTELAGLMKLPLYDSMSMTSVTMPAIVEEVMLCSFP